MPYKGMTRKVKELTVTVIYLLICALLLGSLWGSPAGAEKLATKGGLSQRELTALEQLPLTPDKRQTLKTDLTVLFEAYPEFCTGLDVRKDGKVFVIMRSGQSLLYDDGRAKSFEMQLTSPDLEDMLAQAYPTGPPRQAPPVDFDPGRVRVGAFFEAVYGGSPGEVKANLTPVKFAGTSVSFNAKNGAARALARVGDKVGELLKTRRELAVYVFPLSGTFAPRAIAGTERKSPHAWGIAIDLNAKKGAYWQWGGGSLGKNLLALQQAYPYELVRIFEENGFIWGGRWFHYDTLHFEYRPELLKKAARLQGGKGR